MESGNQVLNVREYGRHDLAAIISLFRDTVRRINARDYAPSQIAAWAPDVIDQSAWGDRLDSSYTIVALVDGVVVGFADLGAGGHLDHLYVHADHQRQGIGRGLLEAIERQAIGENICTLRTDASITARPFFERHGFAVDREQVVGLRGIAMVNYRMSKRLGAMSERKGIN